MIEINLLPEELKVKTQKTTAKSDHIIFIVPLVIGLVLFIHLNLGIVQISRGLSWVSLNKKWTSLEPERRKLSGFKSEYDVSSQETNMLSDLSQKNISWAKQLNKLSQHLPAGVWFDEISVTTKELIIRATVVPLQKDDVDIINQFIYNLRSDAEFNNAFNNMELGAVLKRKIGSYEVADFTLTATTQSK